MVDIRNLLSVSADEIKKPPVWPRGTYHGFIEKYEGGESREKKTPYLRVFLKAQSADATIPADQLEGVDFSKRQFRKDFYLTTDAMWRLKEMLDKIGVATEGRQLAEAVPEIVMKPVMFEITQRASDDGKELYNDVGDISAAA